MPENEERPKLKLKKAPSVSISPVDVRQATFRTAFRGYNRNEVTAFLDRVAKSIETLLKQQRAAGEGALSDGMEELKAERDRLEEQLFALSAEVDHYKEQAKGASEGGEAAVSEELERLKHENMQLRAHLEVAQTGRGPEGASEETAALRSVVETLERELSEARSKQSEPQEKPAAAMELAHRVAEEIKAKAKEEKERTLAGMESLAEEVLTRVRQMREGQD